jgi:hypothetical protein
MTYHGLPCASKPMKIHHARQTLKSDLRGPRIATFPMYQETQNIDYDIGQTPRALIYCRSKDQMKSGLIEMHSIYPGPNFRPMLLSTSDNNSICNKSLELIHFNARRSDDNTCFWPILENLVWSVRTTCRSATKQNIEMIQSRLGRCRKNLIVSRNFHTSYIESRCATNSSRRFTLVAKVEVISISMH